MLAWVPRAGPVRTDRSPLRVEQVEQNWNGPHGHSRPESVGRIPSRFRVGAVRPARLRASRLLARRTVVGETAVSGIFAGPFITGPCVESPWSIPSHSWNRGPGPQPSPSPNVRRFTVNCRAGRGAVAKRCARTGAIQRRFVPGCTRARCWLAWRTLPAAPRLLQRTRAPQSRVSVSEGAWART